MERPIQSSGGDYEHDSFEDERHRVADYAEKIGLSIETAPEDERDTLIRDVNTGLSHSGLAIVKTSGRRYVSPDQMHPEDAARAVAERVGEMFGHESADGVGRIEAAIIKRRKRRR